MPDQPLGAGVTERVEGFGTAQTKGKAKALAIKKAEADWHRSLSEAALLLKELKESPAYCEVYRQLDKEITALIANSDRCMMALSIMRGWRRILDAPKVAEIKLMQLLGPELVSIPRETQAAP